MALPKRSLSKNLSAMKFMQRKNEEESPQSSLSDATLGSFNCHPIEQWIIPNAKTFKTDNGPGSRVIVVDSIAYCVGYNNIGRKSYNKFNPEIEKLMKQKDTDVQTEDEEVIDGTIPALEVAARYEQLMNKTLLSKRPPSQTHSQTKPKRFQKPT